MTTIHPRSRILAHPLLLLPAALLLFVLAAAAGLHHHTDGDAPHDCPLCTMSHTPAVLADATPSVRPVAAAGDVCVVPRAVPGATRREGPGACRAPPTP